MKKTRVCTETLKELVRKDSKKFKKILACVLAIILSVICAGQIYPGIPDDATMNECKQALTNYIEDPISYPIDTQKYSLHLSNGTIQLDTCHYTNAYCVAYILKDGNFNYAICNGAFETIWSICMFTLLLTIVSYFILNGLITFLMWLFPHVKNCYTHIVNEYRTIKSQAEFNISQEEARENPKLVQLKAEYDRAYKKGYNAGFVKGRKEGFVEGQEDAYAFGWTNGYNEAQQNNDEYKTFEEIEAYLADENTPS